MTMMERRLLVNSAEYYCLGGIQVISLRLKNTGSSFCRRSIELNHEFFEAWGMKGRTKRSRARVQATYQNCVKRLKHRARHSREFRHICQFLEAAFSERAFDRRKKRVAPDGTEEAAGKAGSKKREREDIPADRPLAGRSKALASQTERTINNKSRSRDQRNSP